MRDFGPCLCGDPECVRCFPENQDRGKEPTKDEIMQRSLEHLGEGFIKLREVEIAIEQADINIYENEFEVFTNEERGMIRKELADIERKIMQTQTLMKRFAKKYRTRFKILKEGEQ